LDLDPPLPRHRSPHRRWLANQKFEHAAQQIVFQEGIDTIETPLSVCAAFD